MARAGPADTLHDWLGWARDPATAKGTGRALRGRRRQPQLARCRTSRAESLVAAGQNISDHSVERLLNLELFYNPSRADVHLRLAASGVRVLWYLYDFLPYLRPELFPSGTTRHRMDYLRALRGIGGRLAFLSRATRSDYVDRIAHGSGVWRAAGY